MRGSRGGWVPNYHGAWAMIIAPPLLGISLGGFTWRHLLLLVAWWVGFFAFFAAAKWLRARNRSRFTPALVTYGTVTALATLVLLSLTWPLTVWACAYLPLIAATAYLTVTGRERSLLNDIVTIVAAGLTGPVAAHLSDLAGHDVEWAHVWLASALLTAYFVGTAFYVKTNIRRRGDRGFFATSVGYHAALALATTWYVLAAGDPLIHPLHAAVWWVLTARTYLVATVAQGRGRRVSPKIIGIGEILATLAVALTLL